MPEKEIMQKLAPGEILILKMNENVLTCIGNKDGRLYSFVYRISTEEREEESEIDEP